MSGGGDGTQHKLIVCPHGDGQQWLRHSFSCLCFQWAALIDAGGLKNCSRDGRFHIGRPCVHGQVIVAEFDHGHGLSLAQFLCSSVMATAMPASYARHAPHTLISGPELPPYSISFSLPRHTDIRLRARMRSDVPRVCHSPSFAASSGLKGLIPSLGLGYINGHRLGRGFRCPPRPHPKLLRVPPIKTL